MTKWLLTLAAVMVLLSGCGEKSDRPSDNTTNPSTAPAPGESVTPPAKPEPFPAVSEPYHAEQAAANGDVVNVHGKLYNLDKWKLFLANLDVGVPDQVRITQYTDEGDPIFYELVYDGAEVIRYTYDNSRDKFGKDEGRPSTICRGIELEEDKERGSYYLLTGCENDTGTSFSFASEQLE
ncbi:uncharacterized protein DUF4362 [Paenibacillus cellulosilyticus]|uniref:Uncharacterized protein DUF4362 n=1 Tax=Paenibacillus cellulosilyticus TaxID=375489 RepID=A0A2V2YAP1_9BACL|nr:DUF4362 domain-containing protein [Paenibacillus cellulosilyticus]PWV88436.1 uncharacterized protein DUF4362 [Paenibacillus cellulosilyticus]QKS44297.1 DUF4362 domain-containing protein [Paenibacillus cellulosilyticus]